jgi:hypothetical protein
MKSKAIDPDKLESGTMGEECSVPGSQECTRPELLHNIPSVGVKRAENNQLRRRARRKEIR